MKPKNQKFILLLLFTFLSYLSFADEVEDVIELNGLKNTLVMSYYKEGKLQVSVNTPQKIILVNPNAAKVDDEPQTTQYWYRSMLVSEFLEFNNLDLSRVGCVDAKNKFCGISSSYKYVQKYLCNNKPGVTIEFLTTAPGWLYNDFTTVNGCTMKIEDDGSSYGLGQQGTYQQCKEPYKTSKLGAPFNNFLGGGLGLIKPTIAGALLAKKTNKTLYRATMLSPKEVKLGKGFWAKGMDGTRPNQPPPNISLYQHVKGAPSTGLSNINSGYVSTTSESGYALMFTLQYFGGNGYIYYIAPTPNFIDVNNVLGRYTPYVYEHEFSALGQIHWNQIMGWVQVHFGTAQPFVVNPDYQPNRYANMHASQDQYQLAGFPNDHEAWDLYPWRLFTSCSSKIKMTSSNCIPIENEQEFGEDYFYKTLVKTPVYRSDIRPPGEIFQSGFNAWDSNGNDNLLLHLAGDTIYKRTSKLISTTLSSISALTYPATTANFLYVYEIRSDQSFYNVNNSLNFYISTSIAKSINEKNAIRGLFRLFNFENGVITQNKIPSENIILARKYHYNKSSNQYDLIQTISNSNYKDEDTDINVSPYPLSFAKVREFLNKTNAFIKFAVGNDSHSFSTGLCPEVGNPSVAEVNFGCKEVKDRYASPYWIHYLNSTIANDNVGNLHTLIVNTKNGNIYKYDFDINTIENLGKPESSSEITAMASFGHYAIVATSKGNTYVRNVKNDYKWWRQSPRLNSTITAMVGLYPYFNDVFLGTSSGKIYQRKNNNPWEQIGQLPTAITALEFDSEDGDIFVGTQAGKTYAHGIEEPQNTFWELPGTESGDPITTLKIDATEHFIFAGTLGGKLYKKGIQNVTNWIFIGNVHKPVITMNASKMANYMSIGLTNGHVFVRDTYNDAQWWDRGAPAGDSSMVENLNELTQGTSLINSNGLLYLRKRDGYWYKIYQFPQE